MDELACPDCGPTELLAAVSGDGTYMLLCPECREGVVFTSWCAIGPEWEGEVGVYRLGDESTPLLRGDGSAIWEKIERLADKLGEIVILRGVDQPPS